MSVNGFDAETSSKLIFKVFDCLQTSLMLDRQTKTEITSGELFPGEIGNLSRAQYIIGQKNMSVENKLELDRELKNPRTIDNQNNNMNLY